MATYGILIAVIKNGCISVVVVRAHIVIALIAELLALVCTVQGEHTQLTTSCHYLVDV